MSEFLCVSACLLVRPRRSVCAGLSASLCRQLSQGGQDLVYERYFDDIECPHHLAMNGTSFISRRGTSYLIFYHLDDAGRAVLRPMISSGGSSVFVFSVVR